MAGSAIVGGILLALIEGVGILITRYTAPQFSQGFMKHAEYHFYFFYIYYNKLTLFSSVMIMIINEN